MFYRIASVVLLTVVTFIGGVVAGNHCPAVQNLAGGAPCCCKCECCPCPSCQCEDCDCCPACPGHKGCCGAQHKHKHGHKH